MNKKLNFRNFALIVLVGLLSLSITAFAVFYSNADSNNTTLASNVEFESTYVLGEEVSIPVASLTHNGKTKSANSKIITPSGLVYNLDSISLDELGVYTIQYYALFDNEVVRETKTFTVLQSLFTTSSGSSASYGIHPLANDSQYKGILVSLADGGVFKYNKAVDFNNEGKVEAFSLFATPLSIGTPDIGNIYVRFTDIEDENNYLTVSLANDNNIWGVNTTYVSAGTKKQALSGWYFNGTSYDLYQGGTYGTAIGRSMHGLNIPQIITIGIDYANKTIYAFNNNWEEVINLGDAEIFTDVWDGFTTGKAYMSITAGRYVSSSANFVITKLFDEDLSAPYVSDNSAPMLTVKKDNGIVPNGIKGVAYKVFDCEVADDSDKTPTVSVRAYSNYYSSTKSELEIINGYFVPTKAGNYYLEYIANDKFGNQAKEIVYISVLDGRTQEFNLSFVGEQELAYAGKEVAVKDFEISGALGSANVNITATNTNETVVIDAETKKFIPQYAGEYSITYIYSDYVETKEVSYKLNVDNGNLVWSSDEISFNDFYITNFDYRLPELKAYDYSSGAPVEVPVSISSTDSSVSISNNVMNVNGGLNPSDVKNITLKYSASNGQENVSKEFVIKVVNPAYGEENFDCSKYFYSEDGVITGEESYVLAKVDKTASADKSATIRFIKKINSNFNFNMGIVKENNNVSSIDVYITGAKNSLEQLKLSFVKPVDENSATTFILNDTSSFAVSSSFYGGQNFRASFETKKRALSVGDSLNISVSKYLNGLPFNGFTGGEVYFTIVLNDCNEQCWLKINNINSQPLDSTTRKPIFQQNEYNEKVVSLGTRLPLADIGAYGIYEENIPVNVTVLSPSNEIVKDVNGKLLNNVIFDNYEIEFNEYGKYSFNFTAVNYLGQKSTYSYDIEVKNSKKPTLTVEWNILETVKVGNTIAIPQGVSVDADSNKLDVKIFLTLPDGTPAEITEQNIIISMEGKYTVYYYAIDDFGNVAMLNYTFYAEKGDK